MIDFEHTGFGFWGVDQWRLIYSCVVDSFYERIRLVQRRDPSRSALIEEGARGAAQAIQFIERVTDYFSFAETNAARALSPFAEQKCFQPGADNFLIAVIGNIAATVTNQSDCVSALATMQRGVQDDGEPWALMARCAAAKEFDYCCRDFDDGVAGVIGSMLKSVNTCPGRSADLPARFAELLQWVDVATPANEDHLRICARLIFSLSALLATLPSQGVVSAEEKLA